LITMIHGSASVSQQADATIVTLAGEIDMATGDLLRAAFADATALATRDGQHVIVDLAGVTFIDSSGIGIVVDGRRAAMGAGSTVAIRGARDQTLRTLQLIGLEPILDLHPDAVRAKLVDPQ
jgi:anti-anti-sigma factor